MNNFINILDGLMLGDGCISRGKTNKNYHYAQSCKFLEWLDNIKNLLIINGFNANICKVKPYNLNPNFIYNLDSNYNEFFTMQHERWYIKEYNIDEYSTRLWHLDKKTEEWFIWHKTVPNDISLTPECVLNWYLGDGGIYKRTYRKQSFIKISTQGFTKDEIDYLVFLLNEWVVDCAQTNKNKIILINKKSGVKSFLDYINYLYIPDCYKYKFQIKN